MDIGFKRRDTAFFFRLTPREFIILVVLVCAAVGVSVWPPLSDFYPAISQRLY